jgi:hypothetical protein
MADAGDATVKIVDTNTFEVKKIIRVDPQPDSGVVNRKNRIFHVGNGGAHNHCRPCLDQPDFACQ